MHIWCKNSAYQVMTNTRKTKDDSDVLQLHAAIGGTVSGQILLRRWWESFSVTGIDITPAEENSIKPTLLLQEYQLYNDGIPYPDRLVPIRPFDVKGNFTQAVIVHINVPSDARAGKYSYDVTVHSDLGDFTAKILLNVHSVVMPTPKLGALDHEYWFYDTDYTKDYFDYKIDTPEWWELMSCYAKSLKALRVNVLDLWAVTLLAPKSRRIAPTEWEFDFTLLDRFVERFLSLGSFRRIAVHAVLDSLTGENIQSFDESGNVIKIPFRSTEGEAFANCFTSAMYTHFKEKGLASLLVMHIEDEPHESENWKYMREIIRHNMPDIPCSEPIDEYDSVIALKGACDEYIPRVDIFEMAKGYLKARQSAGDKLWCYTCCYPLPEWTEFMNKFIDQPARYSRMLYWTAFANGITGYLHWGFNYWGMPPENVYGLDENARFKGDGHIVYPDKENNDVFMSNRFIATVEGVEEYELLKIAAEKHPEAAKALAVKITRSFNDFSDDAELLEALRIKLFELCE